MIQNRVQKWSNYWWDKIEIVLQISSRKDPIFELFGGSIFANLGSLFWALKPPKTCEFFQAFLLSIRRKRGPDDRYPSSQPLPDTNRLNNCVVHYTNSPLTADLQLKRIVQSRHCFSPGGIRGGSHLCTEKQAKSKEQTTKRDKNKRKTSKQTRKQQIQAQTRALEAHLCTK